MLFTIEANDTNMGEYLATCADDALTMYAHAAGYSSVTAMVAVTGIDHGVMLTQIDFEQLLTTFNAKTGKLLFQDSYGDGVAMLEDGTCFATYTELAQYMHMTLDDFSVVTVSAATILLPSRPLL